MRSTWYKCGSLRIIPLAVLLLLLTAKTAFAQYKTNVFIEAECPSSSTGAYGTKLTSTASFSGQGYIKSQGNTTASTYNNSSADHAVYNFTANQSAYFQVSFRVNSNGSGNNDSLYYRVNGSDWETVNNLANLGTGWRWGAGTSIFVVDPGANTIEIANRETGLEIDKIALLNGGDPVPTGTGGPAYNCPTTMYFEAECATTASGAYPFKQFIAKSGFSGAGYIYSNQNNTGSATSSTDIAIFPFDSGASTYSFHFRVDTNGSGSNDSWFYRVDSGAWTTMNNLSSVNGWRWVQGTATAALGIGRHTLEVRNREKGLNMDKIAFVPSGAAAPSGAGGTSVNCDPAPTMSSWGFWEQTEYVTTHQRFFENQGAMVIDMHVGWHNNNDPGGLNGTGSGTAFLGMHRAMMNEFRAFALARGYRSYIPIDVNSPLPFAVYDASGPLLAAGQTYYDTFYGPRLRDDLTGIMIPPYLTASGGPAVGWWSSTFQFMNPDTGERIGPIYSKLGDIADLDTLGRIIGVSRFHNSVHTTIAGTMGGLGSPSDPFFYGWHGLIDTIVDNWLKTTAGRNWINTHTGHPFLDIGFTHMDGWDDAYWAQQPL
jgi:hypothetical protein